LTFHPPPSPSPVVSKPEKWKIGDVQAIEDRVNGVERWLVDKEKQKGDGKPAGSSVIS
jgi:hypothetical protein